jgi:KaiC/GvpD/RAD55 family RecA-like ATPase
MTGILPTGIEVLDRKLDGGIPQGCVVVLSASPASQSELFLYEMTSPRQTTYLTTERTIPHVQDGLAQAGISLDDIEIHSVTSSDPLDDARDVIDEIPTASTVIVDPMRRLETTETEAYRSFLNELKRTAVETDSLILLHCLDGCRVPEQRDRTEYLADIIFDLSTNLHGGTIENALSIPKFRGGSSLSDAIELDLTTDVTIDVSRKIA